MKKSASLTAEQAHSSKRTEKHRKLQGCHRDILVFPCNAVTLSKHRKGFIICHSCQHCLSKLTEMFRLHPSPCCTKHIPRSVTSSSWLCDKASENASLRDRIKNKQQGWFWHKQTAPPHSHIITLASKR